MDEDFKSRIEKSNASSFSRNYFKNAVLNQTYTLLDLLELATDLSNKNNYKAIWIIELIAEENTTILSNHLSVLISKAPHYSNQSAIRGMSRILYFISTSPVLKLDDLQKNNLIEICLDWFIGNQKVACKAYALKTLTHFRNQFPWLKTTIQDLIEKEYTQQSAGYQAAAREALSKINR